ncbi:DNA methyltransferase [Thiomicrorhabdus sp. zzn3]|uniref:DNA methyltransferase n=1 Tax=Thiomicrorhabdus sp. zzn3 TaxID=3039775 RepID=UPI002437226C|nr:DNA methyltransferase [Thiomicrorhabdus sp. zzn3]MDG6778271.1 DNA methyltransferase [Thiomicrorhabdus sp. zzn3]
MATTQELKSKFTSLLQQMFQLDQPELDFGIYRIMHARKDDINRFIEQDLPKKITEAFAGFEGMDKQQVAEELEKAKQAAIAAGFDPSQSPKVQELEQQYNAKVDLTREEGEVYDALITFFNRYYDEGDFISRRIYKDGTYAIPYNGEEVVLHWANKDQYYIKSSENLRDYAFRLNPHDDENPMRVHFKLVDAEAGASNNNKEAEGKNRVFVLRQSQEQPAWSEVTVKNGNTETTELEIYFEFRAATENDWTESVKASATAAAKKKPPTQDHLRQIAVELLIGEDSNLPEKWKEPLSNKYVKADGETADYSLLQGQLNNYTKANKFDYFIHKDLGKFLRQELDFYIKNELMRWEDIAANKANFAKLGPMFSKIEVIRQLGEAIITFLAQLEDFQKKLWLKKKFVTETQYCITLDRLQESPGLVEIALNNEDQRSEWVELFNVDLAELDKVKSKGVDAVLEHPNYRYLVIDTGCKDLQGNFSYGQDFKEKLISSLDELDEQMNGLLIHSENFQALNLIHDRFKEQVKCIYIDPPYNAQSSEILYKNTFKHSSWISMMENRLSKSKPLLNPNGIKVIAIDEVENDNLAQLVKAVFPNHDDVAVSVVHNPTGQQGKNFSFTHEFAHFIYPTGLDCIGLEDRDDENRESKPDVRPLRNVSSGKNHLRESGANCFYPIYVKDGNIVGFGEVCDKDFHPDDINIEEADGSIAVYPIDPSGVESKWVFARDSVESIFNELSAEYNTTKGHWDILRRKVRFRYKSNWSDKRYSANSWGSVVLNNMMPGNPFTYPKSIYNVLDCVDAALTNQKNGLVLDYFAGSGTTGHAVINLNREDQGNRKYILCEMGAYFDSVTKPRIQKVIYSKDWKGGKPLSDKEGRVNGVSQCFKYIRLESYEDTLGNLALNRPAQIQSDMFNSQNPDLDSAREDYLMNYMLEVESRGSASLLNITQFTDPMAYQLKVRSASGDETKLVNVDLIETFNWLLGLQVEHIAAPIYFEAEFEQTDLGRWQASVKRSSEGQWWFRTVYGVNRKGQTVLVVWRNLPKTAAGKENGLVLDNAVLEAVMLDKLKVRLTESPDDEIELVYVNGDHNITVPKRKDGELLQARVQNIEETFHRLMFATDEGLI